MRRAPVLAAFALPLALFALAACPSSATDRCGDGRFCPPHTVCSPAGVCEAVANQCDRFEDGTACEGSGRWICLEGGCVRSLCGDGFVDPGNGEVCDLGADNSDAPDAECRTDCTAQRCGDGIVDSGEECDEGRENSDLLPGACRAACELSWCGDGVRDPGETPHCFGPGEFLSVGAAPFMVRAADLDGDGFVDLVVTSEGSDPISVLRYSPDGGFTAEALAVGVGPRGLALEDLSGDGHVDVAVANYGGDSVSILYGHGDGSFDDEVRIELGSGARPERLAVARVPTTEDAIVAVANRGDDSVSLLMPDEERAWLEVARHSVGDEPSAVALGDVDGDGHLDVVVANAASGDVSILWGREDGTFEEDDPEARLDVGSAPSAIALADIDGNGRLDIAVANTGSSDVAVLWNGGGRAFLGPDLIPTGTFPTDLAIADVSGDGRLDLVTADSVAGALSLIAGGGDRTFAPALAFEISPTARSVALADFDRDGFTDAAVVDVEGDRIAVAYGGDGPIGRQQRFALVHAPRAVAAGDLTGDGRLDVAVGSGAGESLAIMGGRGRLGLDAPVEVFTGEPVHGIALGDLTGDGRLDAVVATGPGREILALLADGAGGMTLAGRYPAGLGAEAVALADINRNGALDVVVSGASGSISVRFGEGDGTFGEANEQGGWDRVTGQLALADVDGDGVPDLIVSATGNSVAVFLGFGDGTFSEPRETIDELGWLFDLGDISGDGRLDVVIGHREQGTLSVLAGQGGGDFALAHQVELGSPIGDVAIGDVNGSGVADVIATQPERNEVAVLLGIPEADAGGELIVEAPQRFRTGNRPVSLIAADITGSGRDDIAVLNTESADVSLFVGRGPRGD